MHKDPYTGEELAALWPRVWALADEEGGRMGPGRRAVPPDGTDVWYRALQCGADELVAAPPAGIADEALEEWLAWFAREPVEG